MNLPTNLAIDSASPKKAFEGPVRCLDLGLISYSSALEIQENLRQKRLSEAIPDTFLFLEHEPVVTLGRRGNESDLLITRQQFAHSGIAIVEVDRGGQATYHGPGQLVVYLIVNLYQAQRELRILVQRLETAIIQYLKQNFDLIGHTEPEHPGVWIGNEKIAALGISVHQRITMHGIAINLNLGLEPFKMIIPCGISDRQTCSIRSLTGKIVDINQAKRDLAEILVGCFGYAGHFWG